MIEIMDNYKRPDTKAEPGGGKRIVEASGYIPVRVQVENMIQAGLRLDEFRKEKYDYPDADSVDDDVMPDPTRSPNFDLADGTSIARSAGARLEAQARDAAAKQKADSTVLQGIPEKSGEK